MSMSLRKISINDDINIDSLESNVSFFGKTSIQDFLATVNRNTFKEQWKKGVME